MGMDLLTAVYQCCLMSETAHTAPHPADGALAILRVQASSLREITNGILDAKVETTRNEINTSHRLLVVCKAANELRKSILNVYHENEKPYPCTIVTNDNIDKEKCYRDSPDDEYVTECYSHSEFTKYLGKALESQSVVSTIESLIALANDKE